MSDISKIPQHVAIIMDGNGRWAATRHLPRIAGHKQGASSARAVIKKAAEYGVKYLTLYAFSNENWHRPQEEINDLMGLLKYYLNHEIDELHKNNIKIRFIGDFSRVTHDIINLINKSEEKTANNTALCVIIALSYGSKQEIMQAVNHISQAGKTLQDPDDLREYLYTKDIPDPDLLIRTGGEKRLSNFLLWQLSYAELIFSDILWPDYGEADFFSDLQEYAQRERRYGRIDAC
jgi:undecaprenyl diphosphate synthase